MRLFLWVSFATLAPRVRYPSRRSGFFQLVAPLARVSYTQPPAPPKNNHLLKRENK
nr:MAG TPA: hypothetical protein [Caudoviricetes sp.]